MSICTSLRDEMEVAYEMLYLIFKKICCITCNLQNYSYLKSFKTKKIYLVRKL